MIIIVSVRDGGFCLRRCSTSRLYDRVAALIFDVPVPHSC